MEGSGSRSRLKLDPHSNGVSFPDSDLQAEKHSSLLVLNHLLLLLFPLSLFLGCRKPSSKSPQIISLVADFSETGLRFHLFSVFFVFLQENSILSPHSFLSFPFSPVADFSKDQPRPLWSFSTSESSNPLFFCIISTFSKLSSRLMIFFLHPPSTPIPCTKAAYFSGLSAVAPQFMQ